MSSSIIAYLPGSYVGDETLRDSDACSRNFSAKIRDNSLHSRNLSQNVREPTIHSRILYEISENPPYFFRVFLIFRLLSAIIESK